MNYYQTIPKLDIKGRMNTPEEFEKIGLPANLDNANVLDIGCNMGAFMMECIERGAKLVRGVEPDFETRLMANGAFRELRISNKCKTFKNIVEIRAIPQYDLILMLSVLHVMVMGNPQTYLNYVYETLLKPGGLLIVEINDRLQKEPIKLPEGFVYYGRNKDNRSVYHLFKSNIRNPLVGKLG